MELAHFATLLQEIEIETGNVVLHLKNTSSDNKSHLNHGPIISMCTKVLQYIWQKCIDILRCYT